MERILPWLALIVAATVAVVGVIELDNRSDDQDQLAIPTFVQPSPTTPPEATVSLSPRPTPLATVKRTAAAPAPSSVKTPAPSKVETPAPTAAPTRTPSPPRTPTPAPALTAGPIDTSRGPTPHTGGGAWPNGVIIAGLALALRAGLVARRRSY